MWGSALICHSRYSDTENANNTVAFLLPINGASLTAGYTGTQWIWDKQQQQQQQEAAEWTEPVLT